MKFVLSTALAALAASAGMASAQAYYSPPAPAYAHRTSYAPSSPCPVNYHYVTASSGCICDVPATFYSPNGSQYYPSGANVPSYGGQGYNVRLYSPGVRVIGQPVEVPSGQVYVEGAPIYVQAPPVHVASPQIYLQRPKVYVQPSQVTVDPPTVHVAGCEKGEPCQMVGTSRVAVATHHYTGVSH